MTPISLLFRADHTKKELLSKPGGGGSSVRARVGSAGSQENSDRQKDRPNAAVQVRLTCRLPPHRRRRRWRLSLKPNASKGLGFFFFFQGMAEFPTSFTYGVKNRQ